MTEILAALIVIVLAVGAIFGAKWLMQYFMGRGWM